MSFIQSNPNPKNARVGDCVIRAIAIATNSTWEHVYSELAAYGFVMCDMPSSNAVWGQYLKDLGYRRGVIDDNCPEDCYTIQQFCRDNPSGIFILGTGTHVVTVIDGSYYDTWDSGREVQIFYWRI